MPTVRQRRHLSGSAGLDTKRKDGQLTGRTARRRVVRVTVPSDGFSGRAVTRADLLATEEPLGIRVDGSALTVTMRTPGDDVELAARFLVGEAVVRSRDDIAEIRLCDGTSCGHGGHDGMGNIADVLLAPGVEVGSGARRDFMTTSAIFSQNENASSSRAGSPTTISVPVTSSTTSAPASHGQNRAMVCSTV